jgi:hypothetical protein
MLYFITFFAVLSIVHACAQRAYFFKGLKVENCST